MNIELFDYLRIVPLYVHEVSKVAHYWLEVNAMTKPMMVREDGAPYGVKKS